MSWLRFGDFQMQARCRDRPTVVVAFGPQVRDFGDRGPRHPTATDVVSSQQHSDEGHSPGFLCPLVNEHIAGKDFAKALEVP